MVPSRIIEVTIHVIRERVGGELVLLTVEEIRIGVFFTGVSSGSEQTGVAFTPVKEIPVAACCPTSAERMPDAGKITRKGLEEVLAYGLCSNPIKSFNFPSSPPRVSPGKSPGAGHAYGNGRIQCRVDIMVFPIFAWIRSTSIINHMMSNLLGHLRPYQTSHQQKSHLKG
jgi:hypothetical protein